MIAALLSCVGLILLILLSSHVARTRAMRALAAGSRVIQTIRGPVEFAAMGSGPVVLVLHGGMGGWDQAVMLGVSLLAPAGEPVDYARALKQGDVLLRNRFCVVAPSRVGYPRTPLESGRTPAEGADAMAALLDALKIEQAVVVGVSGGGPTALQFAVRHPDRAAALVQVAAISRRHLQPAQTTDSIVGRVVFARGFGWFLDLVYGAALLYFRLFTTHAFTRLLCATETLDKRGIEQRVHSIRRSRDQVRWTRGLLRSGYPLSARKVGLTNDLAQFAAIEEYPVDQIRCPTLVIHGRHDGNVPFDHAEFVSRGVPGANLVVAETCGHLLWASDEEPKIREHAQAFIRKHAAGASHPPECIREERTGRIPVIEGMTPLPERE